MVPFVVPVHGKKFSVHREVLFLPRPFQVIPPCPDGVLYNQSRAKCLIMGEGILQSLHYQGQQRGWRATLNII